MIRLLVADNEMRHELTVAANLDVATTALTALACDSTNSPDHSALCTGELTHDTTAA